MQSGFTAFCLWVAALRGNKRCALILLLYHHDYTPGLDHIYNSCLQQSAHSESRVRQYLSVETTLTLIDHLLVDDKKIISD